MECKVGYDKSREEVIKWELLVKQNCEVLLIRFNERIIVVMIIVVGLVVKYMFVIDMEREVVVILE